MTTDGYQQMRLQPCSDARQKLTNSSEIKLCCHSAITPVPSVTVPIYDESGKIAFAIANFADITPCNQPEQLLAEYNRVVEAEVKKRTQELLVVIEQLQSSQQELIKRQQASEQASFAKSEFLANMSHELRTPLNAILGFTQIMSHDHTLSTENQQNLEIINRAGEHLLNLINDILDISKIEAGRTTLNLSNFDLLHLLDNVQKILQSRATAKGLQLKFEYAANLPRYIQTDASKLRQILLNILSNAIKFTASGSVTLRVKLGTGDKERSPSSCFFPIEHCSARGQRSKATTLSPPSPLSVAHLPSLIFEIQDTGMGIAPQELDLLFEAFRQTESGRKSQQGTGLGLVISRKYVQLMGGDITVFSTVGIGSKFTFNIQVDLISASEIQLPPTPDAVIGLLPQQKQYRILVVDDVTDNRLLLVKLLSSLGFSVREATNGQEALTQWHSWQPHLILMDMRMPVMDGYEATRLIRTHEMQHEKPILTSIRNNSTTQCLPNLRYLSECMSAVQPKTNTRTIIIALTAIAFEEERQKILSSGCDDCICKPFVQGVLLEKLKKYLGIKYITEVKMPKATDLDLDRPILPSETDIVLNLSKMSSDWRKKLYYAAASCSDELIFKLIQQIPSGNNFIAQFIKDLANNYQFEKIMNLIKINAE